MEKQLLLVDDEPDVVETLADLLPMCEIAKASSFEQARNLRFKHDHEFRD